MVSEMYARTYVRTCLALPISILLQALLHKWLDTFDTIAITEDFLAAMGQRWPKATQENVTPADEAAAPAGAADRTILSPTDMAAPKVEVEATADVEVVAPAEVEANAEVEEVDAQPAVDALAQAATVATTSKFQSGVYELVSAIGKYGKVQKSDSVADGEPGTRLIFFAAQYDTSDSLFDTFSVIHYSSRWKTYSQHEATVKDEANLTMSYVTTTGFEKYRDPIINLEQFMEDGQSFLLETTEEGQGGKVRQSTWMRLDNVPAWWVEDAKSKAREAEACRAEKYAPQGSDMWHSQEAQEESPGKIPRKGKADWRGSGWRGSRASGWKKPDTGSSSSATEDPWNRWNADGTSTESLWNSHNLGVFEEVQRPGVLATAATATLPPPPDKEVPDPENTAAWQ